MEKQLISPENPGGYRIYTNTSDPSWTSRWESSVNWDTSAAAGAAAWRTDVMRNANANPASDHAVRVAQGNLQFDLTKTNSLLALSSGVIATLKSGAGVYKVFGMPEAEFPGLPAFEDAVEFKLKASDLKDGLRKTHYAISLDETRYVLNGIFFSFKGDKLTLVATDGRRLALAEVNDLEIPPSQEREFIVRTKAITELMRALKDDGEAQRRASRLPPQHRKDCVRPPQFHQRQNRNHLEYSRSRRSPRRNGRELQRQGHLHRLQSRIPHGPAALPQRRRSSFRAHRRHQPRCAQNQRPFRLRAHAHARRGLTPVRL